MKALFDQVSAICSQVTTQKYSTSFSLGIKFLAPSIRPSIYAIYGFVRLADEVVDSFHDFDQKGLLDQLRLETTAALANKISLNPILNSFQEVVHRYQIDVELIDAFLDSMEMDLKKQVYTAQLYNKYIFGSAEVVGLMCLKVFCNGDEQEYNKLRPAAMKLGSAFQKVNFLRDIKADHYELGRMYFPNMNFECFTEEDKAIIEREINAEFDEALNGILKLPRCAKKGVYLAYIYYKSLFRKIQEIPAQQIMEKRVRVPDFQKALLMLNTFFVPQAPERLSANVG
ncbi:phytoene/squalene synthase family protein [Pedobacter sp. SL55]|uniref:phytoene/squalene synthase family protein n=1 Tax=Pedobacter sp. SL55 TaxID=2995161 RepID=UPI0022701DE9|nr:phytoene/squalene synthase family protein [Pedobacter sp. SL55]WAC40514.1 phytoene/squalene synthase family protein [Pedobacter sp. SL55]